MPDDPHVIARPTSEHAGRKVERSKRNSAGSDTTRSSGASFNAGGIEGSSTRMTKRSSYGYGFPIVKSKKHACTIE